MTDRSHTDLALEAGGPTWKLWMRTGLAPATPKPLGRRALTLALLCWLPPFLFSLRDGLAMGDSIPVPFVNDFVPYARAIVGVILLVLADASVSNRLRVVLHQFHHAKLLQPGAADKFEAIVATARRRTESGLVELALAGISYLGSLSATRRALSHGVSGWMVNVTADGQSLTLAGWWWAVVSVPLFYFLFLRWLYRGVVWSGLLASIARLDLRLVASHPDRAGGLGFLSMGQAAFAILVLVASASFSAVLADEIIHHGSDLAEHYAALAGFALIALVILLAPLLAFTPRLVALKRDALFAYGSLSSRHDSAFQEKWIGVPAQAESLLGDADASSLADLVTGYERAKSLRPVPIDLAAIMPILMAAAIPILPLVATKVPLKDILKGLVRVVM